MVLPETPIIAETIAPADAAAVAEVVRRAAETGTAVYPLGGSKGRVCRWSKAPGCAESPRTAGGGCPKSGIHLSLANLNKVIDYTPDDMTITVEAGVTVAELNARLAANRQWLPIDVPRPERATVGGAIAANAAGPRRYAYGTIRDYLLGFTAVDGSGMIFSGGGRVVKNAAGYNMCRLMAGSRGTLGVITQTTLMVRPLPEAAALLACEVPISGWPRNCWPLWSGCRSSRWPSNSRQAGRTTAIPCSVRCTTGALPG